MDKSFAYFRNGIHQTLAMLKLKSFGCRQDAYGRKTYLCNSLQMRLRAYLADCAATDNLIIDAAVRGGWAEFHFDGCHSL